jgi:NADH pyrophosphatase NudC (nudix superfamily)
MMLGFEIILVIGVITAIGYPLFRSSKGETAIEEGDEYHNLLYRKDAAYLALKELEFDYGSDKIDSEDYLKLKSNMEREAVSILKQIDELKKKTAPAPKQPASRAKKGRFCTVCGEKLTLNDKFCGSCGKKIS